jgi:predicted ATPase
VKKDIRLRFKQIHRSIRSLPDADLPSLTVLTGINGSGKTHLLEAIEQGAVEVEGIPHGQLIRRFDWTTFAPQLDDAASPANLRQQRESVLQNIFNNLEGLRTQLPTYFSHHRIQGDPLLGDVSQLIAVEEAELVAALTRSTLPPQRLHRPQTPVEQIAKGFLTHRANLENSFRQQVQPYGDFGKAVEERSATLGKPLLALTRSEIREALPLTWTGSEVLQLQIANWFTVWHTAWQYNRMNRFFREHEKDETAEYLNDEKFRELYGPEPWDLTNEVLKQAGVRYRFNHPVSGAQSIEQTFELRLVDPEDGTEIQVRDISSGEKVLLAIILLLFQTRGVMGLARMPQLLLLDEVDAPLHPSFTKLLLDIIETHLVERCGLRVILTTHAPSTVALAPAGCVFELTRTPRGLREVSPSQATQILSSGFVSITSTDVIVVTESSDDVDYYQPVHTSLTSSGLVTDHPPLKFVAASKDKKAQVGGGKEQVRNWAPKLAALGLERFKGLIDLDAGNTEDAVIKVIGRYSVENYIYDPLTVASFLLHHGVTQFVSSINLAKQNVAELLRLPAVDIQRTVQELCTWLATSASEPDIAATATLKATYAGGASLQIPKWWFAVRGHDLESLLMTHINPLTSKLINGAVLKSDRRPIINFQTRAFPELVPADFVEVFARLQK